VLRTLQDVAAWALTLLAIGHAAMAVAHRRAEPPTRRRMVSGG